MPRFSRAPKYKAQPVEYGGYRFDSKSEAAYAKYLDARQEPGKLEVLQHHPRFRLGCPENVYEGDELILVGRYPVVDDVKGAETPAFRRNRKLWARFGTLPLRIVRLKLNYSSKDSDGLPVITRIEFEVVHGGRDRRVYGPLAPAWLRS